ncbi:MAG: gamma-glutamyl-gamma-aminobutyrate hydrolase family protein [Candidatus Limnocylindrales bacterium]|jgi:putative glutamine amidotransferase
MPAGPSPATRPLIVITTADAAGSDDPALTLHKAELYADAVGRGGGNAVLVTTATPAAERDRLFGQMAGLLLTGGADIDPALYQEPPAGATGLEPARDELEWAAWLEAERRSVPVLGICRGLQAINVFSGESLLQDVPDHAGTPYGQGPAHTHNLEVDPDSRLARALAEGSPEGLAATDEDDATIELTINSYHHQAVDHARLAPGLRAVGWAASGAGRLVEALESRTDHWVVAVQCHPERTESTPDEFNGVWEAFVRTAREARSARGV